MENKVNTAYADDMQGEKCTVIDSDGFSYSKYVQTEVQPPGVLTGD